MYSMPIIPKQVESMQVLIPVIFVLVILENAFSTAQKLKTLYALPNTPIETNHKYFGFQVFNSAIEEPKIFSITYVIKPINGIINKHKQEHLMPDIILQ